MPAKKSGSNKLASDENRRSERSHGRNSPAYPYEADETLKRVMRDMTKTEVPPLATNKILM